MCKKWIVSLLAVVGFQSMAVDADFGGEYRLRADTGQSKMGEWGNVGDNLQKFKTRSKITASFRPSEAFEANGALYLNIGSGLDARNFLTYGEWMMSDEFALGVGRTTYQIAQGQVVGTNDYEDEPIIFNGIFLSHDSEMLGADMALVTTGGHKEEKTEDGSGENPNHLIVSIDIRSFPEWIKTANLHMISPVNEFDQARAGLTLMGGAMGTGYTLTVASSSLTGPSMDTALLDGALSYTHEMGGSSIKTHVGYHQDGSSYDALWYNKHKYAGKLDMASWGGGLSYAHGGLGYMLDSHKMGVKGYYFMKAQEEAQVKEGDIEVDVYYKKSFDSVAFKIWAGMIKSGEDMTGKSEVALTMKF